MHCPFCAATDTKVTDSRLAGDGAQVRRRRQCVCCNERFTTDEFAELVLPSIIKSDASRVTFDEHKLRSGIAKALQKRPVQVDSYRALLERIKHRLRASGEREIASCTLVNWVMDALRELDQVAYVRFASVYHRFQDLNAFREEIDLLQNGLSAEMKQRQLSLFADAEAL